MHICICTSHIYICYVYPGDVESKVTNKAICGGNGYNVFDLSVADDSTLIVPNFNSPFKLLFLKINSSS